MKTITIFLITLTLIVGVVGCDSNGSDPYADYIKIYDWTDLDNIRNNLVAKYVLMDDLDSSTVGYDDVASSSANGGKGWEPVGTAIVGDVTDIQQLYIPLEPFNGSCDGQGYEIRDLVINRPDDDFVGLFGYVGEGGVVSDIGAAEVVVTGYYYVGGLVGCNDGTIIDSYSIGSVTGEKHVGGLVGYDSGNTVSNSYYNHDESLINGENMITTGALSDEDFEEWLANSKLLDVSERLSQEDGYYLIESVSDFKELLAFGQNASLKFRLTNDLDLGDEPNFFIPYLAGEFDGDGHTISNLSLHHSEYSQLGLFGYLLASGNVTELGVENVNISGFYDVGGLIGYNRGTVSDSYSTGNVTSYWQQTGGLIGWNTGIVSNSYFIGNVAGEGYGYVGGLVGINEGIIINSYATGSVSGGYAVGGLVGRNYETVCDSYASVSVTSDDVCVGGLIGDNVDDGTVGNSHSTGNVIGEGTVGGLVGQHSGTVSNSYSTGSVIGNRYVGGLVGAKTAGTVTNSWANGNVTGNSGVVGSRTAVGGLMGYNNGTVSDCYYTGSVTSDGVCVGGLVGDNVDDGIVSNSYSTGSVIGYSHVGGLVGQHSGTVSNSYSTGSVIGNQHVGGLVGAKTAGTVTNSFWDTETSGKATSDGGTGKITAEMQDITTFTGATWDIVAVANPGIRNTSYIWNIVDDETYPLLSWQS